MTDSCSASRRMPGLALIVVVGALFLGACSSGTAGSGTTPSASLAGGPASTSPSGSASAASSATSSAPSTPPAAVGSATGSGFCKEAALADAAQRKAATSLSVDSPAALQKFEAQSLAKLQQFLAIAPSAIKGDLEVIVAADQKLYNALAAAHFDMRSMNTAILAKLDTPQFKRAVRSITAYLSSACGISSK